MRMMILLACCLALGALQTLAEPIMTVQAALAMAPALLDADQQTADTARRSLSDLPAPVIEALLAAAHDPAADTRGRALLALAAVQRYQQCPAVFLAPALAGLADPDPAVRTAADQAMQWMHDRPDLEMLLHSLRREYGSGLRPRGLEGGYSHGELLTALGWPQNAKPPSVILDGLSSPSPQRQRWCAWLAGWMDQSAAIAPLGALMTSADLQVRLSVTQALGQIFDPRVVSPLVTALADADQTVRSAALSSLGRAYSFAEQYQKNGIDHYVDDATVAQAKALESALRTPVVTAALVRALTDQKASVRTSAVSLLVYFHPTADIVPMLLPLLQDPQPPVRAAAILGLATVQKQFDAVPMLHDEAGIVRAAAVTALARCQRSPDTLLILQPMMQDTDIMVVQATIQAFQYMRDARAVGALCTALADPHEQVRELAARALGAIKDPKAVDALIVTLRDTNALVRVAAVQALGEAGDRKAVPALIGMLNDADDYIRSSLRDSLEQLTQQRFGDDAARWQAWWNAQPK